MNHLDTAALTIEKKLVVQLCLLKWIRRELVLITGYSIHLGYAIQWWQKLSMTCYTQSKNFSIRYYCWRITSCSIGSIYDIQGREGRTSNTNAVMSLFFIKKAFIGSLNIYFYFFIFFLEHVLLINLSTDCWKFVFSWLCKTELAVLYNTSFCTFSTGFHLTKKAEFSQSYEYCLQLFYDFWVTSWNLKRWPNASCDCEPTDVRIPRSSICKEEKKKSLPFLLSDSVLIFNKTYHYEILSVFNFWTKF